MVIMEHVNLITDKDQAHLLGLVEQECALLMPNEPERLGSVSFQLHPHKPSETNFPTDDSLYVFQLRFGMLSLFSHKQLKLNSPGEYMKDITPIIKENKSKIKTALIEYCQNQLETIVTMELEPALRQQFPYLFNYQLKLCQARIKNKYMLDLGWPSLCISISWTDDYGEYQEFMYPLCLNRDTRCFQFDMQQLITALQRFVHALI